MKINLTLKSKNHFCNESKQRCPHKNEDETSQLEKQDLTWVLSLTKLCSRRVICNRNLTHKFIPVRRAKEKENVSQILPLY